MCNISVSCGSIATAPANTLGIGDISVDNINAGSANISNKKTKGQMKSLSEYIKTKRLPNKK